MALAALAVEGQSGLPTRVATTASVIEKILNLFPGCKALPHA